MCVRAHQCARHEDLPGGVSNEGISDFYHFANFRDKCLISNEIELRYVARVNDDTRNNRVLRAIKFAIKISHSFKIDGVDMICDEDKCEKENNKYRFEIWRTFFTSKKDTH